jgi:anti-sigma B factor antagonist
MTNDDIVPGFDGERCEGLRIRLGSVDGVDGCLVIALDGDVGMFNAACLHRRIMKTIDAGFVRLVFDMGNLSSYAAAGAGSLPSVLAAVKPRGGLVVLAGLQPRVAETFEVFGFFRCFFARDTVDEAIAFFRAGGVEGRTGNDLVVPGFDAQPCPHLAVSLRRLEELEGGLLVSLSGYLTRDNSGSFQRRLERAVAAGFHRLVLDMHGYFYTTDAGLEALAGVRAAARSRGGGMVIVGLSTVEEKVYGIVGRARIFTVRKGLAEAVAYLAALREEPASVNEAIVPGFDGEIGDSLSIGLGTLGEVAGGLLLSLRGRLHHYNCGSFVQRVMLAIEAGYVRLAFDLREYAYLNGRGVGSFRAIREAVKPRGGDIVLFGVRPDELDILRRLDVTRLFNVRETLEEAVAHFAGSSGVARSSGVAGG